MSRLEERQNNIRTPEMSGQEESVGVVSPERAESKEEFAAFAKNEALKFGQESDKELEAASASPGLDTEAVDRIKADDGVELDLENLKKEAVAAADKAISSIETGPENLTEKQKEVRQVLSEFDSFMRDSGLAGLTEKELEAKFEAEKNEKPELYAKLDEVSHKVYMMDNLDADTIDIAMNTVSHEETRDYLFDHYLYNRQLNWNPYAQREKLLAGIAKYDVFKNPEDRETAIRKFNRRLTEVQEGSQVSEAENTLRDAERTKINLAHLHNPQPAQNLSFKDLNQTGDRIIEDGEKKIVRRSTYPVGSNLNLDIVGNSYKYSSPSDPSVGIAAMYDRDLNEVEKMHFSSDNPFLSGKAVLDIAERIPVGAAIFKGEDSMSGDSFPLFMRSLSSFEKKTPGRFTVEQIGEFDLNDQGRFSAISKAGSLEEKVVLLNKSIDEYSSLGAVAIPHARIVDLEGGKRKIVLPKLKVMKNF